MKLINKPYICPCCGYVGLQLPPYKNLGFPPWPDHGAPPYFQQYGEPSYDVCNCCGFEFGLDDDYSVDEDDKCTFERFLEEWIASGCKWFDPDRKPKNWKLEEQLKRASIRFSPSPCSSTISEEIFDVVDQCDAIIGRQTRREVHRLGLKHRAVHVLVFNSRGEVFLQKRSMKKDCFPGKWDSSTSGHLDCGETYDACAVRELREEIGLELKTPPRRLFKIDACAETGQEFVWIYRCAAEGPFTLHPEEIERGDWFTPEAVEKWMAERPADFAGALLLIWDRLSTDGRE